MSSSLKELSKIDNWTKYAVYGWIRKMETSLLSQNMPNMIIVLCILFFRRDEIFQVFDEKEIQLSSNKKCITKINRYGRTHIYGSNEISSIVNCKYEWKLRTNERGGSIAIGIGSLNFTTKPFNKLRGFNHLYLSNGDRIMVQQGEYCKYELYGCKFKWNEVNEISICLDLGRAELKFILNGMDQGIAFKNIKKREDVKYRLMVTLWSVDDSVEIQSFSGL